MRIISSKVSDDINIEFKDKQWPDRVVVSADDYKYTVYAADKIFTYGEMNVLPNLARPNEQNDGCVFRVALIEDKVLAGNYGFESDNAYFLRALSVSSNANFLPGSYHEIGSVGWVVEMETQEPFDPEFKLCWFDARDLGDRRLSESEVLVKGLIETTYANIDRADPFVFCGNELVDKGVISVLVDKVWSRLGFETKAAFEKTRLDTTTLPKGLSVSDTHGMVYSMTLKPDLPSVMDAFRLCYSREERQQNYLELFDAVREKAIKEELPTYRVEELLSARAAPTNRVSEAAL